MWVEKKKGGEKERRGGMYKEDVFICNCIFNKKLSIILFQKGMDEQKEKKKVGYWMNLIDCVM